jgi:hypothetical protein
MAGDAKILELPVRLALAAPVHGKENRVVRCIGVHAAGPLFVMVGVALFARLGIEELLAREGSCLVFRGARAEGERRGEEN